MSYNTTHIGQFTRKFSSPFIHDLVLRHLAYVDGLENIPRSGPVILVANHSSYMDHFVTKTLADSVRVGRVWFPTKSEAFDGFLSRVWHESMDCFPVDRNSPSEEIFRRAQQVLEANDTLVLYPEGTRNSGEGLLPFKSGAFRMALANNASVVPIGMAGVAEVLPKGASIPRRRLLSVSIGAPLSTEQIGDERTLARALRDQAYDAISALKIRAVEVDARTHGEALQNMVQLAETMVKEGLTPAGTLPNKTVDSIQLLLRIANVTSERRLDLRLQQTRLKGFRVLNSDTLLGRTVRAARVNREANKLSNTLSNNEFSAYLAGRSSLALPLVLGGGAQKAKAHFERAVEPPGAMASQAYVGLAEACTKSGLYDQAVDAYFQAQCVIDPTDPRAELRTQKIEAALQMLLATNPETI